MEPIFPTDYNSVIQKINLVNPIEYGKTRNYLNGAVTYLSPYISRGVISTKQVLDTMIQKGYQLEQIISFVKELCWRDYFQRVAQHKDLNLAIKKEQDHVIHFDIPVQIMEASTGIQSIDDAITTLYKTGYMHNHNRMYIASLVCNIAKSHWQNPSKWMYYHLLDGDWASNTCSWQWVAGANSNKKYFANQENINKFTLSKQSKTFLDTTYEELESLEIPDGLLETRKFQPIMHLPEATQCIIDASLPTFIYNYYNLDPLWHKDEIGNRILLIEPSFLTQYPMSKNCFDFMLALSKNIPKIQVYIGTFESLKAKFQLSPIYYKEHPLNQGYSGIEEDRDWISKEVTGYFPSFFAYWKKVEKQLNLLILK